MASEGKAECLLGLGVLQAEQLSETTFSPLQMFPRKMQMSVF